MDEFQDMILQLSRDTKYSNEDEYEDNESVQQLYTRQISIENEVKQCVQKYTV